MKFKNKKKNENEDVGFQVASMIDIVFLLLIFFIVASQLQDLEKEQVSLPGASVPSVGVESLRRQSCPRRALSRPSR